MATTNSPDESQQDAPEHLTLEDLWGMPCENCSVGVLLVTLYDPDALHEQGQDLSADNQHESGGRYETQCFACGQHASHVLPTTQDESADE